MLIFSTRLYNDLYCVLDFYRQDRRKLKVNQLSALCGGIGSALRRSSGVRPDLRKYLYISLFTVVCSNRSRTTLSAHSATSAARRRIWHCCPPFPLTSTWASSACAESTVHGLFSATGAQCRRNAQKVSLDCVYLPLQSYLSDIYTYCLIDGSSGSRLRGAAGRLDR